MKRKQLIFKGLILAGLFALGSCASYTQRPYSDDVYGGRAEARPLPEYNRDYDRGDQGTYEEGYSDETYNDYYEGYEDGYYASRLNRFYNYIPGMSYYDPFFDPWMAYPYAGRFSIGMGWGWGNSWYN